MPSKFKVMPTKVFEQWEGGDARRDQGPNDEEALAVAQPVVQQPPQYPAELRSLDNKLRYINQYSQYPPRYICL